MAGSNVFTGAARGCFATTWIGEARKFTVELSIGFRKAGNEKGKGKQDSHADWFGSLQGIEPMAEEKGPFVSAREDGK